VRRPANAAKFLRAKAGAAVAASPIAADPVQGDQAIARAVAIMRADRRARGSGAEIVGRRKRRATKDVAAGLAQDACLEAPKGTRVLP